MKKGQSTGSLDVLYIELTTDCTFDCIHCGNDRNASSLDSNLLKGVLAEFNEHGGKKVILTGGEPLLHPGVRGLLDLADTHSYTKKLSTNGFLLNNPKFDFVLDHDLGFRLSLDGTKECHNLIRKNPGAYDAVLDALRKISRKERQIVVRTTVMQPNKESIVDLVQELDRFTRAESVDLYSMNIWPMRAIGKADRQLMLTPQEYKTFLEDLNRGTRALIPLFRIIVGPAFGMESAFSGGPIQSNEIYKCDILNSSLHVAANGDIYPCSFVHHPLGNIHQDSLYSIFSSEDAHCIREQFMNHANHDCNGCASYESCKAGCIAETYTKLLSGGEKVKDVYCFRGFHDT